MFTKRDVELFNASFDAYLSVLKRRINAEKNQAIRELINAEYLEVGSLKSFVNNPELLKAVKK
ncbi:MAG: hypothetical protein [Microvirus sp.]|nr:MAG: hypothetical protein [Microvirus sp.]